MGVGGEEGVELVGAGPGREVFFFFFLWGKKKKVKVAAGV